MASAERRRLKARIARGWEVLTLVIVLVGTVDSVKPGSTAGAGTEAGPCVFYVAPDGSDSWSGRLLAPNAERTDGPFATITRARDAIRQLKATQGGLQQPVTVFLRGGTYFLREPFILTPDDSGTPSCSITYQAYQDEPVVISGGRRITGWKRATVGGKQLWTAEVPEVREGRWYFRQLWVNGQRRIRARDPNKGYRRVAATPGVAAETPWDRGQAEFEFHVGDLKAQSQAGEAEVVVMNRWVDSHLPIVHVDEPQHRVTFGKRSVFRLEPGDLYYVENTREALDAPGEWYLDRKTGVLSYLPLPGEDLEHAEVVAPVLSQLVRLEGRPEAGQFVEHVSFRGLTFSHTEWWFPASVQTEASGLDVGGFSQAAVGVPGAIVGSGVHACAFENCTVAHVGGYGIELARGCRENRIAGSTLFDLGAGGIKIGETAIRDQPSDQTSANTVSDCHIHDGGLIFHSAVGIWIGQSADNRIIRNHVHDFYYTGLSVGWTWGYEKSLAKGNLIEFNHVHHIGIRSDGDGPILSDMGGIYTLGVQPGTVIRSNVFHDIAGFRYGGWGIYLDEGSSDILVENNLVYRTTHGGFHQHYGRENIVRNNIFALGRDAQIQRTRAELHSSFTFERNIVYWREGALFTGDLSDFHVTFDQNLYWREGDGDIRWGTLSWDEWRAKGMDSHSLVADPIFAAPEKGDFHLKPASPAYKLGFVPIEPGAEASEPPHGR